MIDVTVAKVLLACYANVKISAACRKVVGSKDRAHRDKQTIVSGEARTCALVFLAAPTSAWLLAPETSKLLPRLKTQQVKTKHTARFPNERQEERDTYTTAALTEEPPCLELEKHAR